MIGMVGCQSLRLPVQGFSSISCQINFELPTFKLCTVHTLKELVALKSLLVVYAQVLLAGLERMLMGLQGQWIHSLDCGGNARLKHCWCILTGDHGPFSLQKLT